ncbi:glycosyltransferase family 4 protein [Novipirellula artificiosorum]|uniref:glycosyltransferase family 4 protein n=1 Tax=Novipirellula artificiosorum TaxID=2528016 RepID=UPI0011B84A05|nr:glycosyltransferase family 4 protein [Novipirellula artificiosorum]
MHQAEIAASINFICILSSSTDYLDRLYSLNALGKLIGRNVVICKEVNTDLEKALPEIQFVTPPKYLKGFSFFRWAASQAFKISSSSNAESWNIMEIAGGASLLILRYVYFSKVASSVLFVMPSRTLFLERGWRRDVHSAKIDWRQEFALYKRWLSWSVRERVYANTVNFVFANSQLNLDELQRQCRGRKTGVIPNCVRPPVPMGKPRLFRPDMQWKFLVVSELEPHKGIGCSLEVLRQLRNQGVKYVCNFVGRVSKTNEKWLARTKQKYIDLDGMVSWHGKVSRSSLDEHYRSADILLLTSFYEGSPRVVYEASSHGCVVVASRLSGTQLIDPDDKFLRFFPAGDANAAVSAVLSVMNEGLQSRSEEAMQAMQERFTPEARAARIVSVLSI